jgi:hypothetical protein
MHRLDDVLELLRIYEEADVHDDLIWRVRDGAVVFSALCSDTFHWGTADVEEVAADDLPLLRRCLEDLRRYDEHHLVSALYAARKRGMRPMRLWLSHPHILSSEPARALFLAAGPERDPDSEG